MLVLLMSLLSACSPATLSVEPMPSSVAADCAPEDVAVWFWDTDGDGYGDALQAVEACTAPFGRVLQAGDCDDYDAAISPTATEVCNGQDDDCDGAVDEDDAADALRWFTDEDGDGYGQNVASGCAAPAGAALQGGDCDDDNASIHPDAAEVCGDGLDNDCDNTTDCVWETTVELEDALRITGDTPRSWLGGATALSDLNGDGELELLVGALGTLDDAGMLVGSITSFDTPLAASRQTARDADRTWRGTQDAIGLGEHLGAADIDGDGYDDLITEAQGVWSDSGAVIGAGYVLYGPVTADGGTISPASADWAIRGTAGDRGLGRRLYALSDLDGDGAADFALGNPFAEHDGIDYGGVLYIYTHAEAGESLADEAATAIIAGRTDSEYLGDAATSADVDGDGRSELVVSALNGEPGGAVYLFAAEDLHGTLTGDDAAQTWVGGADRHLLGTALDVGDLDGDGLSDILMSTHHTGSSVAIVWGSADIEGAQYDDSPVIFSGDGVENFGVLARIGDIDGDGRDDVLIAEDTDSTAEGLYGFYGPFGDQARIFAEEADVRYLGPPAWDHAFESILFGDATGDGKGDLIVGSTVADVSRGMVFILPGT